MNSNEYPNVKPGEWIQPIRKGYKMKCCDCGLVHILNFRIYKHRVQFQAFRETVMTTENNTSIIVGTFEDVKVEYTLTNSQLETFLKWQVTSNAQPYFLMKLRDIDLNNPNAEQQVVINLTKEMFKLENQILADGIFKNKYDFSRDWKVI